MPWKSQSHSCTDRYNTMPDTPLEKREHETLDPKDWDALRATAHRMVDDMLSYHQGLDAQPAWRPFPEEVKRALSDEFPVEGLGDAVAYEQFSELIRPYPFGNI